MPIPGRVTEIAMFAVPAAGVGLEVGVGVFVGVGVTQAPFVQILGEVQLLAVHCWSAAFAWVQLLLPLYVVYLQLDLVPLLFEQVFAGAVHCPEQTIVPLQVGVADGQAAPQVKVPPQLSEIVPQLFP